MYRCYKRLIKIIVGVLVVSLISLSNPQNRVCAEGEYTLSTIAEAVQQINDNQYLIPLYLTGNKGIMGFRLYLNYDNELLSIDSITNGLVTGGGNFASDLGPEESASTLSVLWNTTEDVKEDGSLMYIVVTVKDNTTDQISIGLSYSQEDTFNEQWKDVVINCNDIVLGITAKEDEKKIVDNDNNQIPATVKQEIEKHIGNEEENKYIQQAESNILADQQIEKIGIKKIKNAIIRTLKEYNSKSISEIREEDEEEFWEKAKNNLIEFEGVKKGDIKNLNLKTIADQVSITDDEYYSELDSTATDEAKSEHWKTIVYIIAGIIICMVVILVIIIVFKRREKRNE